MYQELPMCNWETDTEALFLSILAFLPDCGDWMFHLSTWCFTATCSLVVK
jgi:hypothetical protein